MPRLLQSQAVGSLAHSLVLSGCRKAAGMRVQQLARTRVPDLRSSRATRDP